MSEDQRSLDIAAALREAAAVCHAWLAFSQADDRVLENPTEVKILYGRMDAAVHTLIGLLMRIDRHVREEAVREEAVREEAVREDA